MNATMLDLTDAEYRKEQGMSQSMLKEFAKSPAHYLKAMGKFFEPTPSQVLGLAIHCKLLEPGQFEQLFVLAPKVDKRTKEGRAMWEEFGKANTGKVFLSFDQIEHIENACLAIGQHKEALELLNKSRKETSVFNELQGVKAKARIDLLNPGFFVADLKTTNDASYETFSKSVFNYGYHFQAAYYLDMVGIKGPFFLICVETDAPYNVAVYELDKDVVERGRFEYISALAKYKKWHSIPFENRWNGYDPIIRTIQLPNWLLN